MKQVKANKTNKVRFTIQDTIVSEILTLGIRPVGADSFVVLPFSNIQTDCHTFLVTFDLPNGAVNDGTHELALLGSQSHLLRATTVQISGNTGIETYIKRT